MDDKLQNIFGYIEGYYGKLLTWEYRFKIIKELKKNNFNTYFYCPKEDSHHRFHWRKKYPTSWVKEYKNFYNFSKKNRINLIAGISPGLDYKYNNFVNLLETPFMALSRALSILVLLVI